MNRGILGQDIFHDTQDVDSFIESVARYIRRFEIAASHWCLMHNHYHLILKLNDHRILSKIAGGLQQIYARRYHTRKCGRRGKRWIPAIHGQEGGAPLPEDGQTRKNNFQIRNCDSAC